MTLIEAARILDEVIPPPHNKMVDGEHFNIAVAWKEIKIALNAQLKQTYAEKVITTLRDDGRSSLSFKDVDNLTPEEMVQILSIAEVYGEWLEAVKKKAVKAFGKSLTKNCKLCGDKKVWEHPNIPGQLMESSCNVEDWPICNECMVEHCTHRNCFGCNYGKYPDCRFLDMKIYYLSNDA